MNTKQTQNSYNYTKPTRNFGWFRVSLLLLFSFGLGTPLVAKAASFYLSPASGSYKVGSNFSVGVYLNSQNTAINAGEAVLLFDPNYLEVKNVSKGGTIFTLWPQAPNFSNSRGAINFSGGLASPGFNGSSGKIIGITFYAKAAGQTSVSFASSAILANDGFGTNVLSAMSSGNYTLTTAPISVVPEGQAPLTPQITSETNPDQNKWYNNNQITFKWELSPNITDVSMLFNQKADSSPGSISEGLFDSKTYSNVKEGIWYFHLRWKNKFGWSEPVHFKVQIDLTPPELEMVLIDDKEAATPQPSLILKANDELSGLSHFLIQVDDSEPIVIPIETLKDNLFKMPQQPPGAHKITVKAYDRAGNFSETKTEATVMPSLLILQLEKTKLSYQLWITSILIIILILIIFFLVGLLIHDWLKQKQKKRRLKKEIDEAEKSLHVGLGKIKKEIRPKEKLFRDLEKVEEELVKEVKDIEKELEK